MNFSSLIVISWLTTEGKRTGKESKVTMSWETQEGRAREYAGRAGLGVRKAKEVEGK